MSSTTNAETRITLSENAAKVDTESKQIQEEDLSTHNCLGIQKKQKNLSAAEYSVLSNFVLNYRGLAFDCELEMVHRYFKNIDRLTIKSIIHTELNNRVRSVHWKYEPNSIQYLKAFEEQSRNSYDTTILVRLALQEGIGPVSLCRLILHEKYKIKNKTQLSRLLKYPNLIQDTKLSANIIQCLACDSQDGPTIDLRRRFLGEEYEFKLKQMANAAGMKYYDENDLRRLGYDKTPDIKMILPFLYKGQVINWIESKANFGDPKTHKGYVQQQLNSYCNRFGAGIVIYWFGYHENIMNPPDDGITILNDFPAIGDIELLKLD